MQLINAIYMSAEFQPTRNFEFYRVHSKQFLYRFGTDADNTVGQEMVSIFTDNYKRTPVWHECMSLSSL